MADIEPGIGNDDFVAPYKPANAKEDLAKVFRETCKLEVELGNALSLTGKKSDPSLACNNANPPANATLQGEAARQDLLKKNVKDLVKALVPFSA